MYMKLRCFNSKRENQEGSRKHEERKRIKEW